MNNFRQVDRQMGFLLPPSVDEWLPERHLARFVVEMIDGLDLRALSHSYRGSGSASYQPAVLLGLLVYGYATGISRVDGGPGRPVEDLRRVQQHVMKPAVMEINALAALTIGVLPGKEGKRVVQIMVNWTHKDAAALQAAMKEEYYYYV